MGRFLRHPDCSHLHPSITWVYVAKLLYTLLMQRDAASAENHVHLCVLAFNLNLFFDIVGIGSMPLVYIGVNIRHIKLDLRVYL